MLIEFVITVISISRHHTPTLSYICWTRLFYLLHTFSFHFSILTLYLIWSDSTLKLYYCLASRHHKGQIPLDGQRPNQTGPDQTRPDKCPHLGFPTRSLTCLVLAKFHYRGPIRLPRKTHLEKPNRVHQMFLSTIVLFLPPSHSDMCSIRWAHFAHN